MHTVYKSLLLTMVIFLVSCGSSKKAVEEDFAAMSANKVIKNHYKQTLAFNTIKGRVKVRYQDAKNSQSVTASLRIEKDKKIWISVSVLGIPMAKALITPTQVSYYEKLNKTYFDGDFSFLSNLLGTDLDYQKVQNMLLGEAIFDLREERFDSEVGDGGYVLTPRRELQLFERLFMVHPSNYKMKQQQLVQPSEDRMLSVSYESYQTVEGKVLPKEIKIKAEEQDSKTKIDLDYRSVKFNEKLNFPFKIPSGYDEIVLE